MNKDLLLTLMNKVIRVDRGGPESRIGKLMAAEDDHFVLLTEKDGIVYYKTQHIKSITLNSRDGMEFSVEDPATDSYLLAPDFKTVVSSLRHNWVKVNRGGPEMLEGIMDEVTDDYITIFSKEEIIRLAMYHVRNISLGTTSEKANDGKKNQENTNENKNEDKNKDDSNEKAANDRGRNTRNRRR
ncbi:hypothetical protein ABE61_00215 [Lysinibacillus sphaericus]|uniref:hypothetical protein n=1 Tax=Lysinibacillus sphaericus TaxID=1421 RepID=UPI0018CCC4F4|nr:hypothetical protein [Lysinibacillus sphaericus]MBG9452553.1 hypothetical protein [Lysinibacillus sphaericus]MBG9477284.1 hypothetical protein [Lysinibacillus sphaericus]MBG9592790.1 hypothetical protein [Lysinibacillus sphaericus]